MKTYKNPQGEIRAYGNEFILESYDDFSLGSWEGLELIDRDTYGELVLARDQGEYLEEGYFLSPIIDLPDFEKMVVSWNSDTPRGTSTELEARALVSYTDNMGQSNKAWTSWLSWGEWSPFIHRKSPSPSTSLARISTDEFTVKGQEGHQVQLRVKLRSQARDKTPSLRLLHGSLKHRKKPIDKYFPDKKDYKNFEASLDTPAYAQGIRDPRTSFGICSPTSLTMIMNSKGEKLLPDEVARNTNDHNYGFGNWAYAAASVAAYGYRAYADYTNIEGLKRQIEGGYPLAVSVSYSNKPDHERLPYIENAPGDTPGHIMVVRGFEFIDGVEYVLVNDSYGKSDEKAARAYKLSQFEKAWSNGMAYMIFDKVKEGEGRPKRLEAQLLKTGVDNEYYLVYQGEIISLRNFTGVLALSYDGEKTFDYIQPCDKDSISLDDRKIKENQYILYVITDEGITYIVQGK